MKNFDLTVLVIYALTMIVLFVIGTCAIDLPIFIFASVVTFVSAVAYVQQQENKRAEENEM